MNEGEREVIERFKKHLASTSIDEMGYYIKASPKDVSALLDLIAAQEKEIQGLRDEHDDYESRRQKAEAWDAVVRTVTLYVSNWASGHTTGQQAITEHVAAAFKSVDTLRAAVVEERWKRNKAEFVVRKDHFNGCYNRTEDCPTCSRYYIERDYDDDQWKAEAREQLRAEGILKD